MARVEAWGHPKDLQLDLEHATHPEAPTGRRRPPGHNYPRLSIELVSDEERGIPWLVRTHAVARHTTVRQWVLDAIREKLEREGR